MDNSHGDTIKGNRNNEISVDDIADVNVLIRKRIFKNYFPMSGAFPMSRDSFRRNYIDGEKVVATKQSLEAQKDNIFDQTYEILHEFYFSVSGVHYRIYGTSSAEEEDALEIQLRKMVDSFKTS